MDVMTYNIRYLNQRDGDDVWGNRKQAVIETIRNADVIGLQEVVAQQLDDIRSGTPNYDWYGVGRDDGELHGEATPIGWRKSRFELLAKGTFWLSSTPSKVGSKGWDAALPRIASWVRLRDSKSNSAFVFLNTHFDHRGKEARAQSAALIRKQSLELANGLPFIMTGDLNARQGTRPLDNLLSNPKGDSGASESGWTLFNARDRTEAKDPGPNSTWNGFKKIEPGQRIDFVLVGPGVDVLRFETLNPKTEAGRFASDHMPLLAKVQAADD